MRNTVARVNFGNFRSQTTIDILFFRCVSLVLLVFCSMYRPRFLRLACCMCPNLFCSVSRAMCSVVADRVVFIQFRLEHTMSCLCAWPYVCAPLFVCYYYITVFNRNVPIRTFWYPRNDYFYVFRYLKYLSNIVCVCVCMYRSE